MHVHALPHAGAERRPRGGLARTLVRRLWVCWRVADLDRELAEGTHPWTSPDLELRAAQLTSAKARARFAAELEGVVAHAGSRECDRSSCVPLRRAAILAASEDLLALAAALRSPAPCRPQSAALISFLLRDGCSPLYNPEAPATPGSLARAARAGFEGT